jgi:hypothetical protein
MPRGWGFAGHRLTYDYGFFSVFFEVLHFPLLVGTE